MQDFLNIQKLLDSLEEIVMVVDTDYRIIVANKRLAEMVGMPLKDVLDKYCYEISHNRNSTCVNNCPLQEVFKNGIYQKVTHIHTFWDGTERYEEIAFTPIKDKDGQVIQVVEIIRDMTESKKIEKQLIHSEKLACMGEIAANLSHEINNPLGIISGFVQRVLSKIKQDDEIYEEIKIVEQECLRCNRIVRDLLNFARPGHLQKNICDLRDVISSTIPLLGYKLKERKVHVLENFGEAPLYIKIDLNQFQQVLVNIFLNALHAMPEGGNLYIGLKLNDDSGKKKIELLIQDEGSGISPVYIDKIFDPFFSTKAEEGTGLGLSLAKRIIEAHGGKIFAKSELGKGTTIIIHLPVIEMD